MSSELAFTVDVHTLIESNLRINPSCSVRRAEWWILKLWNSGISHDPSRRFLRSSCSYACLRREVSLEGELSVLFAYGLLLLSLSEPLNDSANLIPGITHRYVLLKTWHLKVLRIETICPFSEFAKWHESDS
jgi:hypothetical protein